MAITISGTGITSAQLAADGIDGSKIANDAVDSEHYAADSIDAEHYAAGSVDGTAIANDAIDSQHIAADSIDAEHYAAGSVDATAIGNDVVNSQHYAAASIDNEHLADNAVDTAEIADNAITLAKMASGTDGNIISYDASGNPVAIATGSDGQVLTSAGAGQPPAFESAAAGVGGASGVDFNDNVKARWGTGNDLEIYHDGSNSYIKDAGTGVLRIDASTDIVFRNDGNQETMAQFTADGGNSFYHNNAKKLETTATGIDVTGAIAGAGVIKKVYAANAVTMVNGSTSPSNVLGSSGAGVQVTLQSTDSDVMFFANGSVAKNYNGNAEYNMDIEIAGGGFASNTVVVDEVTHNIPDDKVTQWSFVAYDSAPGSTTPTYHIVRNGTPNITYTFTKVNLLILEIIN